MGVTIKTGGTVLLTTDSVQRWQERRAQIVAELADLDRKLNAAAVFMEKDGPQGVVVLKNVAFYGGGEAVAVVGAPNTASDWIEKVVADSDKPLTPKGIRAAVVAAGAGEMMGSENYLYTAIKRLADRNKIVRVGKGYVPALNGSPEGETADRLVRRPINQQAPQNGVTLAGGGVGALPEAGGT